MPVPTIHFGGGESPPKYATGRETIRMKIIDLFDFRGN